MDIFKIIIISLISVALCLILKQTKPELAMLTGLITVIMILLFALNYVGQVVTLIKDLANKAGMPLEIITIILKIIGISYIVEFASNVCKDAGESAIASKIEFAGKCIILTIGMTIIGNFVDTITKFLWGVYEKLNSVYDGYIII